MNRRYPSVLYLDTEGLEKLAEEFAESVSAGDRFYLVGKLGSGKSTFARAFLRARGVEGSIPSPSFILDAVYSIKDMEIHHIDLFRLGGSALELEMLGLEEVLDSGSIVLIEWADKLDDLDARIGVVITLEIVGDPGARKVSIDDRRMAGD